MNKVNPTDKSDVAAIPYNDAVTLKTNFEKQLGDIITRPDAYQFLKRKLVDYSLEQLDLVNVQGDKHNIKSGLNGLIESREFKTENGITTIPSYKTMKNYLNVQGAKDKDSGRERNELKSFYAELIGAISGTKFSLISLIQLKKSKYTITLIKLFNYYAT